MLAITSPKIIGRLLREGRVQANLRHPNIVAVTDVLPVQGAPALVMEYVDGPALDTWLADHAPTLPEGLWLFRGILRGMAAAHDRGVVHRDLKPANVLLAPTADGLVPKVTDFGLVKSLYDQRGDTQQGMSLGTPEYMSPEQIRDASKIDERSDMWGLGCVLYELVCHRRAFQGADKMGTFNLIVKGRYAPPRELAPEIPANVAEAIRRLLEVDPRARLSSCDALFDLLYEQSEHQAGRIDAPSRPIEPLRLESDLPRDAHPPPPPAAVDQLAATGQPAMKRAFGPNNRPPSSLDTVQPLDATSRRPRFALGLLTALFGLAVLTAWMLWYVENKGFAAIGPTLADAVQPTRPVASPIVVGPPVFDDLDTALPPSTAPPTTVPPAPPPRSAQPAPVALGAVRIIGDADQVRIVRDGKAHDPSAPLPIGAYEVHAVFGDGGTAEGRFVVREGVWTTVDCSDAKRACLPLSIAPDRGGARTGDP